MPELPEVETTRKGIKPYTYQQTVAKVVVRQPKLRWPVPSEIEQMEGQLIESVRRRGKYILLETNASTGFSGGFGNAGQGKATGRVVNRVIRYHD